jgi:hypothetical protein
MLRLLALWKRMLSYRKNTWTLEDYPIVVRQQRIELPPNDRMRPIAWSAQILEWVMLGHGDTREEARADLRRHFDEYREAHESLPRPGTKVPISFASSEIVERYDDLARDFLPKVLGFERDDCFISDESSLWDFHGEKTNDDCFRKIAILYGIDVSDVEGAKLSEIFRRIAQHRGHA